MQSLPSSSRRAAIWAAAVAAVALVIGATYNLLLGCEGCGGAPPVPRYVSIPQPLRVSPAMSRVLLYVGDQNFVGFGDNTGLLAQLLAAKLTVSLIQAGFLVADFPQAADAQVRLTVYSRGDDRLEVFDAKGALLEASTLSPPSESCLPGMSRCLYDFYAAVVANRLVESVALARIAAQMPNR